MTIDEALKLLEPFREGVEHGGGKTLADALQLGIEALKRLKETRHDHITFRTLPGETK